jgi:hypothetical protein
MCGPSLTGKSLCGAYLYITSTVEKLGEGEGENLNNIWYEQYTME